MAIENDCKKIDELLDAYHDDELVAADKAKVEAHLTTCQACSLRLTEIGQLVSTLKQLSPLAVPSDFESKLDSLIDAQLAGKSPQIVRAGTPKSNVISFSPRLLAPIAVAAAVALIAIAFNSNPPVNQAPITAQKPAQPDYKPIPAPDANLAKSTSPLDQPEKVADNTAPHVAPPLATSNNGTNHDTPSKPKSVRSPEKVSAPTTQIANNKAGQDTISKQKSIEINSQDEIAELPGAGSGLNEAVGISTDEDGLYDLKM
jgi:anti-sigma factor RsiW